MHLPTKHGNKNDKIDRRKNKFIEIFTLKNINSIKSIKNNFVKIVLLEKINSWLKICKHLPHFYFREYRSELNNSILYFLSKIFNSIFHIICKYIKNNLNYILILNFNLLIFKNLLILKTNKNGKNCFLYFYYPKFCSF